MIIGMVYGKKKIVYYDVKKEAFDALSSFCDAEKYKNKVFVYYEGSGLRGKITIVFKDETETKEMYEEFSILAANTISTFEEG